jgi:broad specificity phosphatase PhoE
VARTIGLMRHCRVDYRAKRTWLTSDEFDEWIEHYNRAGIVSEAAPLNSGIQWDACLSSDLPRAVLTSRLVYEGQVEWNSQLREVEMSPVFRTQARLHIGIWLALGRIAWWFSHRSQPENRSSTNRRASRVLDDIESRPGDHTLVIGHGMFMKAMQQQLRRRGYVGPSFGKPRNGYIYRYVRD